jgi:hypothetical protein
MNTHRTAAKLNPVKGFGEHFSCASLRLCGTALRVPASPCTHLFLLPDAVPKTLCYNAPRGHVVGSAPQTRDPMTNAESAMHSTDTKSRFLELRAQGWSLARIAAHPNVAKRTLVDWKLSPTTFGWLSKPSRSAAPGFGIGIGRSGSALASRASRKKVLIIRCSFVVENCTISAPLLHQNTQSSHRVEGCGVRKCWLEDWGLATR